MFTSDFSAGELAPELKAVFFQWRNASEDGAFPKLTEFGLPNTPHAPNILSVYEIERSETGEPADFKALYARSRISNTLRDKFVGTRLSEHEGFGPGSRIWSCFSEAAASPGPLLVSLPYVGPLPGYRSTSEIYLPLLGEAGGVDYLLTAVVLLEDEYRGPDPG
ncbi:hypothetical protein KUV26_08935 [Leisingera daeponensis]|uniref:PAS domain-containing protein n=1 Tax=Leisingera daeponensis TaxID=405746 RepID=A0ABS7NFS8_9RHOB|nr:hypothetical protein [Leisingera daeponensis]MBY6139554.1 hypothetical protein [Leisingera daeponensis]